MKLPDVNVLLYAYDAAAPQHERARRWLEDSLSELDPTAFAWSALLGFVRIATEAAVYPRPLRIAEALDVVDAWLTHPRSLVVHPGDRHLTILRDLLTAEGIGGALATDAHLAAIAIEHGATLATFDADFHRFEGLALAYLR